MRIHHSLRMVRFEDASSVVMRTTRCEIAPIGTIEIDVVDVMRRIQILALGVVVATSSDCLKVEWVAVVTSTRFVSGRFHVVRSKAVSVVVNKRKQAFNMMFSRCTNHCLSLFEAL